MNTLNMDSPKRQNFDDKNGNKSAIVRNFQTSFFAMNCLVSFPWRYLEQQLECSKSTDLISEILKCTCLHSLCQKFPPSVQFRRTFLTELIRRLEAASCDPLDELYDALAAVVGTEDTNECYKSYLLPSGDAVSLLENVALISDGTTGLVTWEAALYLAEWALDHQQTFTNRTVLELGSGAGLTGITICRSCRPSRFIFSDCHPGVLQRLRSNIRLNGLMEETPPLVRVEELDWAAVTEEQIKQMDADVVMAADVVYDPDIIRSLVELLSAIFRSSCPDVIICSTVRNQETYSSFKQQLEKAGIQHCVIPGAVKHIFPYNRASIIEIIQLHNRNVQ